MRIEDPYTTEYPVSPEEFAGRNEEVDAFKKLTKLTYLSRNNNIYKKK